jgi:PAS domain S-box-containing protein
MGVPLSVLLVEHSERDASFILAKLRSGGYEPQCERVETPAGLATALERQPWDLITCEYVLPEFSAAAALQLIRDRGLDVPVILVCGALDEDAAVALIKAGAHDYVSKHDLTRLLPAIQRELREAEERRARRRAEAALRESELRFANAFTHAPIGMALVETDGKVQRVNRALCQMLGYSEEEFLTMRVWAITHADDIAVTFDQALRLINGELDAWYLEKRFLHKQGHWIWALTSSSLVRGPDGYPAYVISQVQDITARKRAEAAQRNEARVSAALARVGGELIASLDTPDLLDRLCRVTADVLGCDASHTLFWHPEENVFRPIAGYGATPEEEQVAQVIRVPRAAIADLLARLEQDDVTQVGVIPSHVLSDAEQQRLGVGRPLCMALRRGTDLIGLQVEIGRAHV